MDTMGLHNGNTNTKGRSSNNIITDHNKKICRVWKNYLRFTT